MYIDTHTHIYLNQFEEDREIMIQRAIDAGVNRMFMPNIDYNTLNNMFAVAKKFPNHCFAQLGLHPCSVKSDYKNQLDLIFGRFDHMAVSAIGEIGTDLHWDKTFVKEQEDAFRSQIEYAKTKQLPIVIHSREALDLNIKIVSEMQNGSLSGVFHCFNGDLKQFYKIIDLGFKVGLGGVITYKNSGMAAVIAEIDLAHCILETDAPYLSPVPKRGKRNEPSYIPFIAEKIAELKNIELDQVAEITTKNALEFYQINQDAVI